MIRNEPSTSNATAGFVDELDELFDRLRDLIGERGARPARSQPVLVHTTQGATEWTERSLKLALVTKLQRQRQLRARFVDADVAVEPAWPILLELYISELKGIAASTKQLTCSSGVPGTTGLRWISVLVNAGYAERRASAKDKRLALVRITPQAFSAVQNYLQYLESHELS